MKRFLRLLGIKLADPLADRVRQSHADAIVELQNLPAAALDVIEDVTLSPGVETPLAHHLGRRPRGYALSAVRSSSALTPGLVIEYRGTFPTSGAAIDRSKIIVLAAFDYGAPITVDVTVY